MLEEYARGTEQVRKATSALAIEVLVTAVAVAIRAVIVVGRDSSTNVRRGCTDGCKGVVRVSYLTKLGASLSPRHVRVLMVIKVLASVARL